MIDQLSPGLKQRLLAKQLVFTVTTGRSGTAYLATLLGCIPTLTCRHEPAPTFQRSMRTIQHQPSAAVDFWLKQKLPAIAYEPHDIYIETSHLFCKGFLEPLLSLGITPNLIFLKRGHRDVALSLYSLGTIPGTTYGNQWCLSPDDPNVLPLPNWKRLHEYQLCYWYCLEIERRSQAYTQLFEHKQAKICRITFEELINGDGVHKLRQDFNLPGLGFVGSLRYMRRRKRKQNMRADEKIKSAKPTLTVAELEALEQEVIAWTAR